MKQDEGLEAEIDGMGAMKMLFRGDCFWANPSACDAASLTYC